MKQKYTILKNNEKKALIIREFAELNKETLSLLCEQTYDEKIITSAIAKGKRSLISKLRTQSMFPPAAYAEKIAESVMDLYSSPNSDSNQSVELFFDDKETLIKTQDDFDIKDDLENGLETGSKLTGLLENDTNIEDIIAPIKIAEDNSVDVEEDI